MCAQQMREGDIESPPLSRRRYSARLFSRFLVGDSDDFRIRFEREANGKVVRVIIRSLGGEQSHTRSSE
jgi:hypothetical protein